MSFATTLEEVLFLRSQNRDLGRENALLKEQLVLAKEALRKIAHDDYTPADDNEVWDTPTMIWQSVAKVALAKTDAKLSNDVGDLYAAASGHPQKPRLTDDLREKS